MIDKLRAENLRKQYGKEFLLECSLEVNKGPLYTVVGPNGSGKSTLLRILGLIEQPDTGKVIYDENGVSMVNPCDHLAFRRRIVLVPTRAPLFHESVYDNVAYGLRLRKTEREEIKQRVMDALNDVGLEHKEKNNARDLSSGEAQRLALARAFAIEPDVLLLDEPTASLDPENTRIVENIVAEWRRKSGRIILIVTHNLHQARALSDYIIFMYRGKIAEFSSSHSFFSNPSSELSQKYVSGQMY